MEAPVPTDPSRAALAAVFSWGDAGTTREHQRDSSSKRPVLSIPSEHGKEQTQPVERWLCGPQDRSAPETKWVFTGSVMAKEGFVAQNMGNIVVTHLDPAAIVNNGTSSAMNDELYQVRSDKVPAAGTPVTLVLSRSGKARR